MNLEEQRDDDPRTRWLRRVVWLLLFVGIGACLSEGANSPPDPRFEEPAARSPVEAFGEIAFRVQPAGEGIPSTTEFCALLADNDEQRARGLMGREDLGGYDGMVFAFGDEDTTSGFHMRNTLLPLTVAWYDADGAFVGAAEMEPCPGDGDCPSYAPPAPYRFAIELAQDDVDRIGLGPDSRLDVGGACPAPGT